MVDDAAVSLKGRGVRLGHPDGGFSGPPQLFMLPDARVVGVPGSAGEAAVVHEEQAGAQQEHEKHRNPMTLHEHKDTSNTQEQIEPCCTGAPATITLFILILPTSCVSRHVRSKLKKRKRVGGTPPSNYRFHLRAQAWSRHWQDVTLLMMILN